MCCCASFKALTFAASAAAERAAAAARALAAALVVTVLADPTDVPGERAEDGAGVCRRREAAERTRAALS